MPPILLSREILYPLSFLEHQIFYLKIYGTSSPPMEQNIERVASPAPFHFQEVRLGTASAASFYQTDLEKAELSSRYLSSIILRKSPGLRYISFARASSPR